jgi:REP element-mobilizing transposase RayT
MASRPRRFAAGAPAHLTARSVAGLPLFPTTADCFEFLRLLKKITKRIRWTVAAWCLMGTHYHLLVFTPDPEAAPLALQTLNSSYARYFNATHDRRGHVFGARYTETLVETERHLHAALAYVLENPVRAGLVREPTDWAWSGDALLEPRPLRRIVAPRSPKRHILVRLGG